MTSSQATSDLSVTAIDWAGNESSGTRLGAGRACGCSGSAMSGCALLLAAIAGVVRRRRVLQAASRTFLSSFRSFWMFR